MTGVSTGSPARVLRLPRGRRLPLDPAPRVMGVLNVTPDSFSDGGRFPDTDSAVDAALQMASDGAAIIDVGGESTRPGAAFVPAGQELDRVAPVIEGIRSRSDVVISIDTRKAFVARAAVDAGADLINDVSALRFDPEMAGLVRDLDVPVILMHMRGEPGTMQEQIRFEDLIGEIRSELAERMDAARDCGIDRDQILIDPGIGFGKTFDHNLEILARASRFAELAPLVIGASRKAFIGERTGRLGGRPRMAGSLAAVAAATLAGASIVRVHDVPETVDFVRVFQSIREVGR